MPREPWPEPDENAPVMDMRFALLVALGLLCWMPALLVGIFCLGGK